MAVTVLRVSGTYRPPKRRKLNSKQPKVDSKSNDIDEQPEIQQIMADNSDIDISIKKEGKAKCMFNFLNELPDKKWRPPPKDTCKSKVTTLVIFHSGFESLLALLDL